MLPYSFYKYFNKDWNMSNLSIIELTKPGREWRARKMFDKLTSRQPDPFELTNGTKAVLKADPATLKLLSGDIAKLKNIKTLSFTDPKGNVVPLNKIKKSKEFGGGGGSGAGAEVTDIAESAQAVYAQALFSFKKIDGSTLQKASTTAKTTSTLTEIQNLPDDWIKSSIAGANCIKKNLTKSASRPVIFHRQSSWVKSLEKHVMQLNKRHDSIFSDINKWSPADIYLTTAKGMSIDFSSTTNLVELNSLLNSARESGDIVGISLKKIAGSGNFKLYNVGEKKKEIKYLDYTVGKRGYFNSKDSYIFFTVDGSIQFRTFPGFQGEIKGKNASQGKIGYGIVAKIIRMKFGVISPDISTTKTLIKRKDPKFLKEFHDLYLEYSRDTEVIYDQEIFVKTIYNLGEEYILSKYLGTQIINIILTKKLLPQYKTKAKPVDVFISSVVEYASATSDLSGPYAKVE